MTSFDLSTLFFRDRRLLSLAICLIVVAGLGALVVLPRMEDPVLTQRAALVTTIYPGANAERVEALVTEKLEAAIQEIDKIKQLRSVSRDGISIITVELKDTVARNRADGEWSRIRDKISDVQVLLPPDALEPRFEKLSVTAYALIVALKWDFPGPPNYAILRRYAEELDDRLREVHGTKEVDIFGAPEEEILVTLRQEELALRQLTVRDVADQLRASDSRVSAGAQRGTKNDLLLETDSSFDSLARIRETPIQVTSTGEMVAVADIANISKSVKTPQDTQAIIDGDLGISVAAFVLPDKRVDVWFDDVRQVLVDFEAQLPVGITQDVRFEQDTYVRGRLLTLSWNLLLGATAVVLVIGLMMGWRSAVVVGITLPLASLMVLSGLNFIGIPLHQMSITGLIIALGLLIDNAIVIVDETTQRLRAGKSPEAAVRESVRHLAVPLLGSTVTTALSFAPIAIMVGPAGEFVGSIAISVLLAIFSSFLLAMTITPAIAGTFRPRRELEKRPTWFQEGIRFPHMAQLYHQTLGWLFQRPLVGVVIGLVLPLAGFMAATTLTEQFFPLADRDQINVQMELAQSSSLENTRKLASRVRSVMLEDEGVVGVDWYLGASAPPFYYNMLATRVGVPQYGQALVQLKESRGASQVIHRLQRRLNQTFPEARILVRQLEQGPPFEAPIEIRLFGPDLDLIRELGNRVRRILAETPSVVHVTTDLGETAPTISLEVDEEQARVVGISRIEIAQQMDANLEGAIGGLVLEQAEELPVRVRSTGEVRRELSQIGSMQIMTPGQTGPRRAVPLESLAELRLVSRVPSIRHWNTQRMNEIRGYIEAGTLAADVLADFQAKLDASGLEFPPGYHFEYGGESAHRDEAVGNLMANVVVLAVLMVATLVLSFSSYRVACIVGAVAVLSVGLSLGALALFGFPFGFMATIGAMGLIGVAINDTIVVLAAIRDDEAARSGNARAMSDVVLRSTRHVLATTITTIAGFTPLLLGGGGFWPPLATAIAGGVAGATILALLFGPCCYRILLCRQKGSSPVEHPPTLTAKPAGKVVVAN